ncbi:MAG: hypothetical protein D6766_04920 [Verrucomicrobia bacterium]|nr:MAG: hypothetical protein D6766_04920 [Verrucomicrobiota bacterium]
MALLVTAGAIALWLATLAQIPMKRPELAPIPTERGPALELISGGRIADWFDPARIAALIPTNAPDNPFFTRHFEPPPKPPPKPPPTTRRASLFYQGSIRTSGERLHAFIRFDNKTVIVTNGAHLGANLYVARIAVEQVTVTNTAGVTNVLPWRKPVTIEVPIKP